MISIDKEEERLKTARSKQLIIDEFNKNKEESRRMNEEIIRNSPQVIQATNDLGRAREYQELEKLKINLTPNPYINDDFTGLNQNKVATLVTNHPDKLAQMAYKNGLDRQKALGFELDRKIGLAKLLANDKAIQDKENQLENSIQDMLDRANYDSMSKELFRSSMELGKDFLPDSSTSLVDYSKMANFKRGGYETIGDLAKGTSSLLNMSMEGLEAFAKGTFTDKSYMEALNEARDKTAYLSSLGGDALNQFGNKFIQKARDTNAEVAHSGEGLMEAWQDDGISTWDKLGLTLKQAPAHITENLARSAGEMIGTGAMMTPMGVAKKGLAKALLGGAGLGGSATNFAARAEREFLENQGKDTTGILSGERILSHLPKGLAYAGLNLMDLGAIKHLGKVALGTPKKVSSNLAKTVTPSALKDGVKKGVNSASKAGVKQAYNELKKSAPFKALKGAGKGLAYVGAGGAFEAVSEGLQEALELSITDPNITPQDRAKTINQAMLVGGITGGAIGGGVPAVKAVGAVTSKAKELHYNKKEKVKAREDVVRNYGKFYDNQGNIKEDIDQAELSEWVDKAIDPKNALDKDKQSSKIYEKAKEEYDKVSFLDVEYDIQAISKELGKLGKTSKEYEKAIAFSSINKDRLTKVYQADSNVKSYLNDKDDTKFDNIPKLKKIKDDIHSSIELSKELKNTPKDVKEYIFKNVMNLSKEDTKTVKTLLNKIEDVPSLGFYYHQGANFDGVMAGSDGELKVPDISKASKDILKLLSHTRSKGELNLTNFEESIKELNEDNSLDIAKPIKNKDIKIEHKVVDEKLYYDIDGKNISFSGEKGEATLNALENEIYEKTVDKSSDEIYNIDNETKLDIAKKSLKVFTTKYEKEPLDTKTSMPVSYTKKILDKITNRDKSVSVDKVLTKQELEFFDELMSNPYVIDILMKSLDSEVTISIDKDTKQAVRTINPSAKAFTNIDSIKEFISALPSSSLKEELVGKYQAVVAVSNVLRHRDGAKKDNYMLVEGDILNDSIKLFESSQKLNLSYRNKLITNKEYNAKFDKISSKLNTLINRADIRKQAYEKASSMVDTEFFTKHGSKIYYAYSYETNNNDPIIITKESEFSDNPSLKYIKDLVFKDSLEVAKKEEAISSYNKRPNNKYMIGYITEDLSMADSALILPKIIKDTLHSLKYVKKAIVNDGSVGIYRRNKAVSQTLELSKTEIIDINTGKIDLSEFKKKSRELQAKKELLKKHITRLERVNTHTIESYQSLVNKKNLLDRVEKDIAQITLDLSNYGVSLITLNTGTAIEEDHTAEFVDTLDMLNQYKKISDFEKEVDKVLAKATELKSKKSVFSAIMGHTLEALAKLVKSYSSVLDEFKEQAKLYQQKYGREFYEALGIENMGNTPLTITKDFKNYSKLLNKKVPANKEIINPKLAKELNKYKVLQKMIAQESKIKEYGIKDHDLYNTIDESLKELTYDKGFLDYYDINVWNKEVLKLLDNSTIPLEDYKVANLSYPRFRELLNKVDIKALDKSRHYFLDLYDTDGSLKEPFAKALYIAFLKALFKTNTSGEVVIKNSGKSTLEVMKDKKTDINSAFQSAIATAFEDVLNSHPNDNTVIAEVYQLKEMLGKSLTSLLSTLATEKDFLDLLDESEARKKNFTFNKPFSLKKEVLAELKKIDDKLIKIRLFEPNISQNKDNYYNVIRFNNSTLKGSALRNVRDSKAQLAYEVHIGKTYQNDSQTIDSFLGVYEELKQGEFDGFFELFKSIKEYKNLKASPDGRKLLFKSPACSNFLDSVWLFLNENVSSSVAWKFLDEFKSRYDVKELPNSSESITSDYNTALMVQTDRFISKVNNIYEAVEIAPTVGDSPFTLNLDTAINDRSSYKYHKFNIDSNKEIRYMNTGLSQSQINNKATYEKTFDDYSTLARYSIQALEIKDLNKEVMNKESVKAVDKLFEETVNTIRQVYRANKNDKLPVIASKAIQALGEDISLVQMTRFIQALGESNLESNSKIDYKSVKIYKLPMISIDIQTAGPMIIAALESVSEVTGKISKNSGAFHTSADDLVMNSQTDNYISIGYATLLGLLDVTKTKVISTFMKETLPSSITTYKDLKNDLYDSLLLKYESNSDTKGRKIARFLIEELFRKHKDNELIDIKDLHKLSREEVVKKLIGQEIRKKSKPILQLFFYAAGVAKITGNFGIAFFEDLILKFIENYQLVYNKNKDSLFQENWNKVLTYINNDSYKLSDNEKKEICMNLYDISLKDVQKLDIEATFDNIISDVMFADAILGTNDVNKLSNLLDNDTFNNIKDSLTRVFKDSVEQGLNTVAPMQRQVNETLTIAVNHLIYQIFKAIQKRALDLPERKVLNIIKDDNHGDIYMDISRIDTSDLMDMLKDEFKNHTEEFNKLFGLNLSKDEAVPVFMDILKKDVNTDTKNPYIEAKAILLGDTNDGKEATAVMANHVNLTNIGAAFLTNLGQGGDSSIQTLLKILNAQYVFLDLFDALYTGATNAQYLESQMNELAIKFLLDLDSNKAYKTLLGLYDNIEKFYENTQNDPIIDHILKGKSKEDYIQTLSSMITLMKLNSKSLVETPTYSNIANSNIWLNDKFHSLTSYKNTHTEVLDKELAKVKEVRKNIHLYSQVCTGLKLNLNEYDITNATGMNKFTKSVNTYLDSVKDLLKKVYMNDISRLDFFLHSIIPNKNSDERMDTLDLNTIKDILLGKRLSINTTVEFKDSLNDFFSNSDNLNILKTLSILTENPKNVVSSSKSKVIDSLLEDHSTFDYIKEFLDESNKLPKGYIDTTLLKLLTENIANDKVILSSLLDRAKDSTSSSSKAFINKTKLVLNSSDTNKLASTESDKNSIKKNIIQDVKSFGFLDKVSKGLEDIAIRLYSAKRESKELDLTLDDIIFINFIKEKLFNNTPNKLSKDLLISVKKSMHLSKSKDINSINLQEVFDHLEANVGTKLVYTLLPKNDQEFLDSIITSKDSNAEARKLVNKPIPREFELGFNQATKPGYIKHSQRTLDDAQKELDTILDKEILIGVNKNQILDIFNELKEYDTGANEEHIKFQLDMLSNFIDRAEPFFKPDLKIRILKSIEPKSLQGSFDKNKNLISIYLNKESRNKMSAREVYLHEMFHAISEYVMSSTDPRMKPLQDEVRFMQRLVVNHIDNSPSIKMELAMKLGFRNDMKEFNFYFLDYMRNDPSEFLAISMSNKAINDLMKTIPMDKDGKLTLFDKIVNLFKNIVNSLFDYGLSIKGSNSAEAMFDLVNRIGMANNDLYGVYKEARVTGILSKTFDTLDKAVNPITSSLAKVSVDKLQKILDRSLESGNKLLGIWAVIRSIPHIGNPDTTIHQKVNSVLSDLLNFKADGWLIQTMATFTKDDVGKTLNKEWKAKSDRIDKDRNLVELSIKQHLKSLFTKELSKEEQEMLTNVIKKSDLTCLEYDFETIFKKFLSTNNVIRQSNIDDEINYLTNTLKDIVINSGEGMGSYYEDIMRNIDTLATFMQTGEVKGYLLSNATNIANNLQTGKKSSKRLNPVKLDTTSIIPLIDQIVTLKVVKTLPNEDLKLLTSLYLNERDGLSEMFEFIKKSNELNRADLEKDGVSVSNMQKGYVRYSTNNSIDIQLGLLSDKKKMEDLGYELISTYNYGLSKNTPNSMAVYVNRYYFKQGFTRGIIRTTDNTSRGFSVASHIKAINPNDNELELRGKVIGVVSTISNKYANTNTKDWEEMKLIPIFNQKGTIVDFKFVLEPKIKETLELTDISIYDAIANETSRVFDKLESSKHNISFVRNWDTYYEENKNNPHIKFIEISSTNNTPKYKEVWDILPKGMKDYINDSSKRGGKVGKLYLRADILTNITGHTDVRLTEAEFFKKYITNGKIVKYSRWLEGAIMKLAGYTRENIVLKNPAVFVDNMISNFSVLAHYNIYPDQAMRDFVEGVKYLEMYEKLSLKKLQLERALKEEANSLLRKKRIEEQLAKVNEELSKNPMKAFDDKGLISNIVTEQSFMDESTNKDFIDDYVEDILDTLPPQLKVVWDNVFIRENTKHHQLLAKLTQYSDLLSRYSLWKHQKDKMSQLELFNLLDKSFINYTTLDNKYLKYINDIGLFRFTKYFIRSQQYIMHNMIGEKLARVLTTKVLFNMLGFDLVTPLGSFLPRKMLGLEYALNRPLLGDLTSLFDKGYGDVFSINNQLEYIGSKF